VKDRGVGLGVGRKAEKGGKLTEGWGGDEKRYLGALNFGKKIGCIKPAWLDKRGETTKDTTLWDKEGKN